DTHHNHHKSYINLPHGRPTHTAASNRRRPIRPQILRDGAPPLLPGPAIVVQPPGLEGGLGGALGGAREAAELGEDLADAGRVGPGGEDGLLVEAAEPQQQEAVARVVGVELDPVALDDAGEGDARGAGVVARPPRHQQRPVGALERAVARDQRQVRPRARAVHRQHLVPARLAPAPVRQRVAHHRVVPLHHEPLVHREVLHHERLPRGRRGGVLLSVRPVAVVRGPREAVAFHLCRI
ncbi:uncharacterized protein BO66DRAFT_453048, partial [Aspergillus aculeatinus CBS 121060]